MYGIFPQRLGSLRGAGKAGARFMRGVRRLGWALVVGWTALGAGPAEAQSFFQNLFGSGGASSEPRSRPGPSLRTYFRFSPYGNYSPRSPYDDGYGYGSGAGLKTYCVRACDGFFWPISSHASQSQLYGQARQCESSCDTEARLFYLPEESQALDSMTDLSGRTYASLPTAFAYKKALVAGCSCRPMPWSQTERARHKQYARTDRLDREARQSPEWIPAPAAPFEEPRLGLTGDILPSGRPRLPPVISSAPVMAGGNPLPGPSGYGPEGYGPEAFAPPPYQQDGYALPPQPYGAGMPAPPVGFEGLEPSEPPEGASLESDTDVMLPGPRRGPRASAARRLQPPTPGSDWNWSVDVEISPGEDRPGDEPHDEPHDKPNNGSHGKPSWPRR